MSKFAYYTNLRLLKNHNGVVNGEPRILNVDTGNYSYGYVEVNTEATSPFARTKVHDGLFEGDSDIRTGSLILDRSDTRYYLVMSTKAVYNGDMTAYYDSTCYYVNAICTVSRFTGGTKDFFGKDTVATAQTIYSNVYAMINPQSYDTNVQQDIVGQADKIKIAIKATYDIRVNDRITSPRGKSYIVENIDEDSLIDQDGSGLLILYCNEDAR